MCTRLKDIKIYLFRLKVMFDTYKYLSSIQAKTFSIILKINGSLNGLKRYPLKMIINDFMMLQELMVKDQSLSYYKIIETKVVTNYLLSRNELINTGYNMSRGNSFIINNIINDITNNLATDNYLSETEIYTILKRNYNDRK